MLDLFQAIRVGEESEFFSLAEVVPIGATNDFNQTLLHEAIAFKRPRIAAWLINRGIDVNHQDHNGQTPLHFLVSHPDLELLSKVLAAGGDPNRRDKHGNGALWAAVFNARGQHDMVRLLLEAGGDPLLRNNAGRTPLDFARQIGDQVLTGILEGAIRRVRPEW